MRRALLAILICVGVPFSVLAQEASRGNKSDSPGGTWGLKAGVGVASVKWTVGPIDASDTAFAPSASFFYKITDNVDVNLSGFYFSAKDDVSRGTAKADVTRLAVGARYWPIPDSGINPYLGCGIGYYLLDGEMNHVYCACHGTTATGKLTIDDAAGAYLEGGIAWKVANNFFINTDLSYDFLLSSSDATIGPENPDFDIHAIAVNLGITWMF
jgi:outer membrane protein W